MHRCHRAVVAIVLGLIISVGGTGVATGESETLTELAASALASHETVARAQSQVRRAQADVGLAASVLLPRLDLNGSYIRYKEAQTFDLGGGQSFEIRPSSDWNWSADLKQTLFYGLRDWRARDVALLQRDIARLEQRTAAADLVLQVAQAFFEAVATEQRLQVSRAAMAQLEEQRRVAQRRYDVGEAVQADVLRWKAEVAGQRQSVVVDEGAMELARRRLARLAGVATVSTLAAPGPIPVPRGSDQALVETALGQRYEMATLRHQLEASGLMVKIEKGAWFPELDVTAQYFRQKAQFPTPDSLSLTLGLRVPIYDGGLTKARVAQAREDLFEVRLLERELTKGITDQVEAAAIGYRSASAALQAAEERQQAAVEAHRQVEKAYRVGEASATDLLEVTTALTDAKTAVIIARAQRQLSAIALRHAAGEPPLPDLDLEPGVDEEDAS